MLRLVSLTLEDFGPFKGRQRLEFPERGVSIVYGENGRGKTTLLNAIRYALFGKVLGWGSASNELKELANWETADERPPSFQVSLDFLFGSVEYKLTRTFGPKGPLGILEPDCLMTVSGQALSPQERQKELSRILPEEIARFFLFDGELLQQYRELLVPGSDQGESLKRAIEKILGMPILSNAKIDISLALSEARKELAQAASANAKTRQLGEALIDAQANLDLHKKNIAQLSKEIQELEREKQDLDARLAGTEKAQRMVGQRDVLLNRRSHLRIEQKSLQDALRAASQDSWKILLQPRLLSELEEIAAKLSSYEAQRNAAIYAAQQIERLQRAAESRQCPTCHQGLSEHTRQEILGELDLDGLALEDLTRTISKLTVRKNQLSSLGASALKNELLAREDAFVKSRIETVEIDSELATINEQLSKVAELELRRVMQTIANTEVALRSAETALRKELIESAQIENIIIKLQAQWDSLRGSRSETDAEKKVRLLNQLQELFEKAIVRHRDKLKESVEEEASSIFRALSREPDYSRLEINDHYGLTIFHKDGGQIPTRSAGFEHLVSVALIGALQRCAPIKGPIIVDSPFGRLDDTHKRNFVQALPMLAPQVMLLVYETELDRAAAVDSLGNSLVKEFVLTRQSARHTEIEVRS